MADRRSGLDLEGVGVGLKQVAVVVAGVFAIALAVVVGKQMSAEAMAVVIGVVCGVAAGIPTSVLLLLVMTRRDAERARRVEEQAGQRSYPPVVVIQGGMPQSLPPGQQAGYWPAPHPGPSAQRQFHVVGGDDLLLDDGSW